MKNNDCTGRDALLSDYCSTPLSEALAMMNAMQRMSNKSAQSLLPEMELSGVEKKTSVAQAAIVDAVRQIVFDERLSQLAEMAGLPETAPLATTEQVVERMLCR
jgi:hypothetical protein